MRIASPRPQVRLLLILIIPSIRTAAASCVRQQQYRTRSTSTTNMCHTRHQVCMVPVNGTSASSGSYRPLSSSMLPLRLLESGKGDDQGRQNGATEAAPTEYGSLPFTYCKYSINSSSSIILLHHTMHLAAAASVYQVTCTWTGRLIDQSEK